MFVLHNWIWNGTDVRNSQGTICDTVVVVVATLCDRHGRLPGYKQFKWSNEIPSARHYWFPRIWARIIKFSLSPRKETSLKSNDTTSVGPNPPKSPIGVALGRLNARDTPERNPLLSLFDRYLCLLLALYNLIAQIIMSNVLRPEFFILPYFGPRSSSSPSTSNATSPILWNVVKYLWKFGLEKSQSDSIVWTRGGGLIKPLPLLLPFTQSFPQSRWPSEYISTTRAPISTSVLYFTICDLNAPSKHIQRECE